MIMPHAHENEIHPAPSRCLIHYSQDSTTGKQTSYETEAHSLLNALNEP